MLASAAQAEVFPLAFQQDSIGEPGQTQAEQHDTLPEVARQHHLQNAGSLSIGTPPSVYFKKPTAFRPASRSTAGSHRIPPRWCAEKGREEKRRGIHRGVHACINCWIYFDTDFLNMRSIFSLIASIAVEFC